MRLAIVVLALVGCSSNEGGDAFQFKVQIWDRNAADTLTSPDGPILPDGDQFFQVTTTYPSYEAALADAEVTVAVLRDGEQLSEATVRLRDCTEACNGSCSGLGTIVFQNTSLSVDADGIIEFDQLACWECNGTLAGAEACH